MKPRDSETLSRRFFQQAVFQLLLTLDAVACPWYGVQALGIDLLTAGDALAKIAFANASKGVLYHLQQLPVGIALVKEKFLVIGARGLIGDVLCRVFVGAAAILLGARDHAPQFLLARLQSFLETF